MALGRCRLPSSLEGLPVPASFKRCWGSKNDDPVRL